MTLRLHRYLRKLHLTHTRSKMAKLLHTPILNLPIKFVAVLLFAIVSITSLLLMTNNLDDVLALVIVILTPIVWTVIGYVIGKSIRSLTALFVYTWIRIGLFVFLSVLMLLNQSSVYLFALTIFFFIIFEFGFWHSRKAELILFLQSLRRQAKKITLISFSIIAVSGITWGIIISIKWIDSTQTRLSQMEQRFGSPEKLACDPAKLPELLKPSIVRIIGNQMEGTGFAISPTEIITNFHVIDKEPNPKIIYNDNRIAIPVDIIGSKNADLAILKTNEVFPPLIQLSQTKSKIVFGEPVYSVGYPNGSDLPGPPLLSLGSFGGYRTLSLANTSMDVIQTNTSLIQGMSGGPLVDACGNVIAINTMGEPGMGMYIDINFAMNIADSFNQSDVTKLKVDPITPNGAVKSFYDLINAARWDEAYGLLSPERRKMDTFANWKNGYKDTVHVDVVKAIYKEGKVQVKLFSRDWIDGAISQKYFEGDLSVVFAGDVWNLTTSNIKQIPEPDGYRWWYE